MFSFRTWLRKLSCRFNWDLLIAAPFVSFRGPLHLAPPRLLHWSQPPARAHCAPAGDRPRCSRRAAIAAANRRNQEPEAIASEPGGSLGASDRRTSSIL